MTVGVCSFRSRVLGRLGLTVVVTLLCACTARSLEAPTIVPDLTWPGLGGFVQNRNVDLLFLVDDSSSMHLSQDNLLRNFPSFMTALRAIPGGLPNVHIAVVSSDMGAGDGSIFRCDSTGGKKGIFQYTARGTCAATGLDPGATFISDVAGVRNYTGNLPDVFTCIGALGENGCGFEQPFAAITRALGADGQPPPAENQGFLRPDAYLAIVFISNEDDCSVPAGSPLFDTTAANQSLDSILGPPANFRCNEFGHVCDGARPGRLAPGNDVNATRAYGSCEPSDGSGLLLNVADTAARIKALKADPEQVIVAAITGPVVPYAVHWRAPVVGDTGPWPEITNSCTASDGSFADPSIRTSALVREFGANGLLMSICDDDFAPALQRIADKISDRFTKPCIAGTVAKRPGTSSDDCTVVGTTPDGAGGLIESVLSSCADATAGGACWQLGAGENGCTGQSLTVVQAAAAATPAWQSVRVQCALCAPGIPDPARGCP